MDAHPEAGGFIHTNSDCLVVVWNVVAVFLFAKQPSSTHPPHSPSSSESRGSVYYCPSGTRTDIE